MHFNAVIYNMFLVSKRILYKKIDNNEFPNKSKRYIPGD